MHTYFISDLHLTPERPQISDAFFRFMRESAPTAERLYILGDLFEYWIGDDAAELIGAEPILEVMRQVAEQTECFFIAGNRDFLVRNRFSQRTGFTILPDETVIDLYGEPTLLLHGDSLCTDDLAHQEFRRKLMCNRLVCGLILCLPRWYRLKKAVRARAASQSRQAGMSAQIMDVAEKTVVDAFEQHNIVQMIHGHTHRQAVHKHQTKLGAARRFVLGDWHTSSSILTATAKGLVIENQGI